MTATLADKPKTASTLPDNVTSEEESRFLTFKLANEEYGVQVLKVRQITGLMKITAVAQMPRYMKGVINLRGQLIPVVDLRLKFGLEEIERTPQTCIIIVDVGKEIGILIDAVSDVLDIPSTEIEPPPSMGTLMNSSFILGMDKVGDAVKILLDIDRVLTTDELVDIESVASTAASPRQSAIAKSLT